MKEAPLYAVVTTILPPTPALRLTGAALENEGGSLVVVGDRKSPPAFDLPGTRFLSLPDQAMLPFRLSALLPVDHYSRKNLGYLLAIRDGAGCIYETDDDNSPSPGWRRRPAVTKARLAERCEWVNAYRYFTSEKIWPRGFPLRHAAESGSPGFSGGSPATDVTAPIQQGLADVSPDVDAVWRLVLDRDFSFSNGESVCLPPGAWCPFNSQSTWWHPVAWPLMYLPSFCSFRMTDIWRSFIAQRCLWELGHGVVFHAPEVRQDRNPHDLMRDFADEVPGYLRNEEMVRILSEMELAEGENAVYGNLLLCYERLVAAAFFPADELRLVKAWLDDLDPIAGAGMAGRDST